MDIKKIIDNIEKYHYLGCGSENCKIISSSDSRSDAKEEAIKFLKPHWNNLIGTTIFLVIIRKSAKGKWEKEKHQLLDGPINMEISEYIIKENYKLKFTDSGINSLVFFSEEYLKKHKKIRTKDIISSVEKYKKKELKKGLMSSNVL